MAGHRRGRQPPRAGARHGGPFRGGGPQGQGGPPCRGARAARRAAGSTVFSPAGTDFSSSVAWVAEKMGLPGNFATRRPCAPRTSASCGRRSRGRASRARDSRAGRAMGPRCCPVAALEFPLVVKPVDNMGARGVQRVDITRTRLQDACRRRAAPFRDPPASSWRSIMEGSEFSLDAVVDRGRVTVCGMADRHIFFPPSFVEMGHTMPTRTGGPRTGHREAFAAGIAALGIDTGAAKGRHQAHPAGTDDRRDRRAAFRRIHVRVGRSRFPRASRSRRRLSISPSACRPVTWCKRARGWALKGRSFRSREKSRMSRERKAREVPRHRGGVCPRFRGRQRGISRQQRGEVRERACRRRNPGEGRRGCKNRPWSGPRVAGAAAGGDHDISLPRDRQ